MVTLEVVENFVVTQLRFVCVYLEGKKQRISNATSLSSRIRNMLERVVRIYGTKSIPLRQDTSQAQATVASWV